MEKNDWYNKLVIHYVVRRYNLNTHKMYDEDKIMVWDCRFYTETQDVILAMVNTYKVISIKEYDGFYWKGKLEDFMVKNLSRIYIR